MTQSLVYFECELEHLGTIIGKIGEDMVHVREFRVETVKPIDRPIRTRNGACSPAPAGSKKLQLPRNSKVLAALRNDLKAAGYTGRSRDALRSVLVNNGLAETSIHAGLSYLRRNGEIQEKNGIVSLIQETPSKE